MAGAGELSEYVTFSAYLKDRDPQWFKDLSTETNPVERYWRRSPVTSTGIGRPDFRNILRRLSTCTRNTSATQKAADDLSPDVRPLPQSHPVQQNRYPLLNH